MSEDEIALLIETAKSDGGIDYALERISEYRAEALALLDSLNIPEECRKALAAYLEYVIAREK